MKNTLQILLLIYIVTSCAPNNKNSDLNPEGVIISIDLHKSKEKDPDIFFDYDSFLILETNDDCLLSSINKVIFHNQYLFILDRKQHTVFIFERENGSFVRKINRKGPGNEEYHDITDFIIDKQNNNVLVYNGEQGELFWYDFMGNFLQRKKAISGYLLTQTENEFIFYLGNGYSSFDKEHVYNNLVIYDKDLKEKKEYLPFNKHMLGKVYVFGSVFSVFTYYHDDIYILPFLSNTIYYFDKENLSPIPMFYINFIGDKKSVINEASSSNEVKVYFSDIFNGEIASYITNFYYIKDKMFFSYLYKDSPAEVYCIYDIQAQSVVLADFKISSSGLFFKPLVYESDTYDDRILTSLTGSQLSICLKKYEGDSPILKQISDLVDDLEDCNPILLFYRFKN